MSRLFEELDHQQTPIGVISLRRRLEPTLKIDVFEIKIGEDGLMSSLITDGEEAVSRLALAATSNTSLDVVVGGLGLGYTAQTVLDDPRVTSLRVIDALAPVIDWHERHLIPLGESVSTDKRCEFVLGNFFEIAANGMDVGADAPDQFDAIIVDIDHSPRHLLDPSNAPFYEADGVERLAPCIRPGGVFPLWWSDPPDAEYLAVLNGAFDTAVAEVVVFDNVLTGGTAESTIYVATV